MAQFPPKSTEDPTKKPFRWLVILYSFLYVRWQMIIPGINVLKIPGILTYGFALWFLIKGDRTILIREPLVRYIVLFIGLMTLTCTYAVHVSAFYVTQYLILLLLPFICPLIILVKDWNRISDFFFYWVLINLGVSLWAIKTHGTGTGDFLTDENDLALAMSMAIPYPVYLMQTSTITRKRKYICLAAIVTACIAIVVSFSRGGFVGLVAIGLSLLILSERKLRNLLISATAILVLGGLALNFLPKGYTDRLHTMTDPENSTRVERLRSWEIGWIMWKANPIIGVGAAQYPWNVQYYERKTSYWIDEVRTRSLSGRQAHSMYFTLLPELGLVGVTIFGLMVFNIVRYLWRIIRAVPAAQLQPKRQRKNAKNDEPINDHAKDAALLAKAIACSMIGFFTSGAFISVLYYPHIWLIAGFVTVLKNFALPPEESKVLKRFRATPPSLHKAEQTPAQ